ncbi:AY074887 [Phodopus roborovskii]|uniref:AY074887 protein n=1 Tax=Phodopus roborovskii TaxID=109678 RepID=A0AAU9ZSF8_PHORO|nr:AY074887 [Phodopus roborovskii]
MAQHPRQIWLPSVRRTARGRGSEDAEILLVGGGDHLPTRGGIGGKILFCSKVEQIPCTHCVPLSLSLLYHSNEAQTSNCRQNQIA